MQYVKITLGRESTIQNAVHVREIITEMSTQALTARFISASIDCKRGQLFIAQNAGNMDTILGELALEELVVPVWPSTPEALEACEAFPVSPTIARCTHT
jgi:hypothetical protein